MATTGGRVWWAVWYRGRSGQRVPVKKSFAGEQLQVRAGSEAEALALARTKVRPCYLGLVLEVTAEGGQS